MQEYIDLREKYINQAKSVTLIDISDVDTVIIDASRCILSWNPSGGYEICIKY
jgi:hypothetical protein